MVWPDDVPPGGRTEASPTLWQRFRQRYGNRLLVTAFVSAGVAVWSVAVAGRGQEPRVGMASGVLVALGLLALARPAWGFTFGQRWTYREEPEPSEAFLFFTRAVGAVMLVLGLWTGLVFTQPVEEPGNGTTIVPSNGIVVGP